VGGKRVVLDIISLGHGGNRGENTKTEKVGEKKKIIKKIKKTPGKNKQQRQVS